MSRNLCLSWTIPLHDQQLLLVSWSGSPWSFRHSLTLSSTSLQMSNDVAPPRASKRRRNADVRFCTKPEFVVCSWSWTVMRNLFSLVVNREKFHEFFHHRRENSWKFSRFTTKAQTCLLSIFFYVAFKSESCDAKQTYLKLTTADGSASRIENKSRRATG